MTNETASSRAARNGAIAFTVDRAELLRCATLAARVTEKRNTNPILSNVYLATFGVGALSVTATDLDLWLKEELPCEVRTGGAVTVPAFALRDTLKRMRGDMVTVTAEAGSVDVALSCGGSSARLAALPADDFPQPLADLTESRSFDLDAATFADDLGSTCAFSSTEEARYYLNGVYMHAAKDDAGCDVLRYVATDGHRMARLTRKLPAIEGGELDGYIVPRKACAMIGHIVGRKATGAASVQLSASKIAVAYGGVRMVAKLIDGTFPDYTRVIPTANDKRALIVAGDLADAVASVASVASSGGTRAVVLDWAPGDVLQLAAHDLENGKATGELACDYAGEAMAIGFNAKYLHDGCRAFGKDAVLTFTMADARSPTLIERSVPGALTVVLMPMWVDALPSRAAVEAAIGDPVAADAIIEALPDAVIAAVVVGQAAADAGDAEAHADAVDVIRAHYGPESATDAEPDDAGEPVTVAPEARACPVIPSPCSPFAEPVACQAAEPMPYAPEGYTREAWEHELAARAGAPLGVAEPIPAQSGAEEAARVPEPSGEALAVELAATVAALLQRVAALEAGQSSAVADDGRADVETARADAAERDATDWRTIAEQNSAHVDAARAELDAEKRRADALQGLLDSVTARLVIAERAAGKRAVTVQRSRSYWADVKLASATISRAEAERDVALSRAHVAEAAAARLKMLAPLAGIKWGGGHTGAAVNLKRAA